MPLFNFTLTSYAQLNTSYRSTVRARVCVETIVQANPPQVTGY
jgi:hypothetical protein